MTTPGAMDRILPDIAQGAPQSMDTALGQLDSSRLPPWPRRLLALAEKLAMALDDIIEWESEHGLAEPNEDHPPY